MKKETAYVTKIVIFVVIKIMDKRDDINLCYTKQTYIYDECALPEYLLN